MHLRMETVLERDDRQQITPGSDGKRHVYPHGNTTQIRGATQNRCRGRDRDTARRHWNEPVIDLVETVDERERHAESADMLFDQLGRAEKQRDDRGLDETG